ncbi:MAG TPA: AgmX/PglI C-terminal domain-containing protein [Polyangiaceae bacterium]|nr:AgmX/PglI C-terminal domain-containing protein [Polyangiaceae bacterium]
MTRIAGRLRPEVIQKVVRAIFGKFRVCYEDGLSRDPMLSGKVVVHFVIGRTGKVSNAAIGRGSTIPDQRVVECVVSAFYDIEFPEPNGGIVTVVYPIMLSPG